ncbi:DUF2235 domain-containing protein [Trinickia sp. YCB016]
MSNNASLLRAPAHPMNTEGVVPTLPELMCRAERCEFRIHVGVFFDGTGNNQDWIEPKAAGTQLERQKDSNVARLFRAYKDDHLAGYYRHYIPGVGTPFPDIGEDLARDTLGMGFGAGGEARIGFGLLAVLNSMHASVDVRDRLQIELSTVRALCRNGWLSLQTGSEDSPNPLSPSDQFELAKVGMKDKGGLLTYNGISHRTTFLKEQFAQLAQKIEDTKHPKLKEVFIDVFGFSRGAAEARVFCNWLDECFEGDMLAGVRTHIRFLGIFDTVAAVSLGPAASQWANGHSDWGATKHLRISPRVAHCEHYVAMHEQRESFPLEDVQLPGDVMPRNCRQFRFPGMHSDLGGGYLPGEQGKNGGADDNKLSQIPLNMMYEAARAALVPVDRTNASRDGTSGDPFELSDKLRSSYLAFIQANGTGVRSIADCLIDILAWRYTCVRSNVYEKLNFVLQATAEDRRDLLGAHEVFLKDITEIRQARDDIYRSESRVDTAQFSLKGKLWDLPLAESERADAYRAEARIPRDRRSIFELITARNLRQVELNFFTNYCHDSYAGFKPFSGVKGRLASRNAPWESGGYLQFRTRYAGESVRHAMHEYRSANAANA